MLLSLDAIVFYLLHLISHTIIFVFVDIVHLVSTVLGTVIPTSLKKRNGQQCIYECRVTYLITGCYGTLHGWIKRAC